MERWLAVRKRLAVRYEPVAGASGGVPVPTELSRDVPAFTGREAELAALRRPSRRPAGAGAVSLISGRAGVGKTALAVRLAHQIADRYPDGHLFLRLGGSGPHGTSVPTKDALALLLRALGAVPAAPPESVEQSVAAYRGSLAGRRVLIILDDAGSSAQVRPLLPATPSCRVIVTSRGPLSGLAAGDGAHRMSLEAFSDAEAVSSLARAGAAGRLTAEPGAALRVARMCGRLTLGPEHRGRVPGRPPRHVRRQPGRPARRRAPPGGGGGAGRRGFRRRPGGPVPGVPDAAAAWCAAVPLAGAPPGTGVQPVFSSSRPRRPDLAHPAGTAAGLVRRGGRRTTPRRSASDRAIPGRPTGSTGPCAPRRAVILVLVARPPSGNVLPAPGGRPRGRIGGANQTKPLTGVAFWWGMV